MIPERCPRPRLFPKSYVRIIVQDVQDVCRNVQRPPKSEKRPEEHLSKQVYHLLKRNPRYYSGPLEPHIESWLPDLESRADIRFSCGKGIETYFIFEAKRLFVTHPGGKSAKLVAEYVNEGMMRFVGERYARYQQASAMLGYVFDVTPTEAEAEVGLAIERDREKLCLSTSLSTSLMKVTPPVDETCHNIRGRPFLLYHLFVTIPSVATSK